MTDDEFEEHNRVYKRRRNLILLLIAVQMFSMAIGFHNLNKARAYRDSALSRLAVVQREIDQTQVMQDETRKMCGALR